MSYNNEIHTGFFWYFDWKSTNRAVAVEIWSPLESKDIELSPRKAEARVAEEVPEQTSTTVMSGAARSCKNRKYKSQGFS